MAEEKYLDVDLSKTPKPKKDVKKADIGELGSEKHKRITAALEQETEDIKNWAKRQEAERRAAGAKTNFLGVADMLKADEQKRQALIGGGSGSGRGPLISGGGGGGGGGGGSLLHRLNPQALMHKKGGAVKSKSASSRADGCAQRGKTKGRMV